MFTTLLWDVDGTLLDFKAAEKAAIADCFEQFGIPPYTPQMIERYSKINQYYWQQLELGTVEKPKMLVQRFADFFEEYGIDCDPAAFNQLYQSRLGEHVVFFPYALETLQKNKGKYKQYAVTNGTATAQHKKLSKSGLDQIFDGIFISDLLGAEKPDIAFFNQVFDAIGNPKKEEVLIIGDSLSGDMKGGNNAGIATCWFNPKGLPKNLEVTVDFEIASLKELEDII